MQPKNSNLRLELGILYEEMGQLDKALMVYRQASYIGNADADHRINIIVKEVQ